MLLPDGLQHKFSDRVLIDLIDRQTFEISVFEESLIIRIISQDGVVTEFQIFGFPPFLIHFPECRDDERSIFLDVVINDCFIQIFLTYLTYQPPIWRFNGFFWEICIPLAVLPCQYLNFVL